MSSADTLTATSRAFYERSKAKVVISIFAAAGGMMLLGFCSSTGGQSSAANTRADQSNITDDEESAQLALAGGYGFASFCFIVGFILLTAAAIYISPLFCGSNNERKMIRAPEEIDATYSAYSEKSSPASAPNQV